jgi:hypothetical protein
VKALARSTFHRLEVLAVILVRFLRCITMHPESGSRAAINESWHASRSIFENKKAPATEGKPRLKANWGPKERSKRHKE